MAEIAIRKPKRANQGRVTIDIVVNSPSGLHHITRLTYTRKGLYDVPLTWRSGVDEHTSYHPSGQMHQKVTRGKLMVLPGGQVLGEAKPHTRDREVLLWQSKSQPWASFAGCERLREPNMCFTEINALASGYPVVEKIEGDYAFTIEPENLSSPNVAIEYFLVERENKQSLEAKIREFIDNWHNPYESVIIEKAEILTNLSPWFAIVLFAKRASGSQSFLSGSQLVHRSQSAASAECSAL